MSGGQKQRISVARSVYSNGSLYLLDDPLSAVDSHVGKHIFEQVIGPEGLLKKKTRILVTHGVGYLSQMDRIFVMKEGRISEQGTYRELLAEGGDFAQFLVQYLTEEAEKENLDVQTESELEDLKHELERSLGKQKLLRQMSVAKSIKTNLSDFGTDNESMVSGVPGGGVRKRKRTVSHIPSGSAGGASAVATAAEEIPTLGTGTQLIEDEKAEIGGVKWSIYRHYIKSIGWSFSVSTILFYLTYQSFQLAGNIWLSEWSTDPLATTDIGVRNKYLIVYGVLGFFQSGFIMVATACVMIGTLNAATKLHSTMLFRIMRSPMSFFDTTPLGQFLYYACGIVWMIID